MARSPVRPPRSAEVPLVAANVDDLVTAAMDRGSDSFETGRYIVTYKQHAAEEGARALSAAGLRVADARDFAEQAVSVADLSDAQALNFPEIGAAVVSAGALEQMGASLQAAVAAADSPMATIEPEYFVFAQGDVDAFLRGFRSAAEAIARDLGAPAAAEPGPEVEVQALGATWGLVRCKVPPSPRSGAEIKVAVLDTGMDLGHPDFAGRTFVSQTFVGQPVQDLHGHGTHCIGTSCGPKSPAGTTPRYGIAHRASIFVGKVLTNSGKGVTGSVLAGMNWAIANRCAVISMSLEGQSPVQAAYTAAGSAALAKGCLIIAAAGNEAAPTGAPANSPTILSVASLDPSLGPSSFSNFGKIEIAGPGRDVFSSVPMPARYGFKSGTSMATPHVAGCAALWAESSPVLRATALWNKLQSTAKTLPFSAAKVGKGLVQAP